MTHWTKPPRARAALTLPCMVLSLLWGPAARAQTTAPDTATTLPVPAEIPSWLTQAQGAPADRWSLEKCIATALDRNIDARTARAQTEQAKGTSLGAWSGILPSLTGNMGASRIVPDKQSSFRGLTVDSVLFGDNLPHETFATRTEYLQAGATLGTNIISVPSWKEKNRRDHLKRGAVEGEAETRNGVVYVVKQQYFTLLKAQRLADVSRESERLASSCPFLYVWDGEKFVFLTDVLGVAPLGELLPDGSRMKPYPEEFVRLPQGLRDQNGMYVFQVTDELREVDYVDQLRMVAVDHPADEEIYSNEIFTSSPSSPALHAVRGKHFPVAAVDDKANDVLPLLRDVDGRYPTDFRRNRIPGLADVHSLTLDLGDAPASQPLTLWLAGWVFWMDSNGSRALMSNSQLQMVPPYLQVRNEQGEWVTVIPDMGLPSGTNRTMRVDLTGKFRSADRQVRIVTNFCVYWDQVFFTSGEAPAPSPVELPLVSADLHYRGFSQPASDLSHTKPDYFDYANLLADAPWNPMIGNYTRYGDTEKLVTHADDRLVVMATGDELTVKFDGRALPPVKPGWKRTFFLYTHGWAKDGEPNTAYSKTVEPLPFRQMSNYPYGSDERFPDSPDYREYLREHQTRGRYLLIPPLAPPVH